MVVEKCIDLILNATGEVGEVPNSFFKWLINNKRYFLFIFSLSPLAIKYLGLLFGEEWAKDIDSLIAITAAIQCLFILFAIFLPVRENRFLVDPYNDKESRNCYTDKSCDKVNENQNNDCEVVANKALMQFIKAWTFLWTSWFLLYLTLFIKNITHLLPSSPSFDENLRLLLNLFNTSATAVFMICYVVFAKITVFDKDSLKSTSYQVQMGEISNKFPLELAIGLSVIIIELFGFIDFLFPDNGITRWLSSILAGIAMAFFLGRLNNKFINPSIFIIVCLYSYMAIQTLFPFWLDSHNDFIVLFSANLAFLFKIVLYLFMLWLFRSGRLLYYLKEERKLIHSVDEDWDKFVSSGIFKRNSTTNNKISCSQYSPEGIK